MYLYKHKHNASSTTTTTTTTPDASTVTVRFGGGGGGAGSEWWWSRGWAEELRPYYTMRCLTGDFISPRVFHFTSRFSSRFRYQHVGIQNASENARKIKNASPTRDNVTILHYALGKNASQLLFGRVLVAFWSRFGHKHCQNANPTHSVIRPLKLSDPADPFSDLGPLVPCTRPDLRHFVR